MEASFRIAPLAALRAAAALGLGLSLLLPSRGLYGLDLCLFHRLTGMPCPGCGMTRAFSAIGHGQFARAWALHPFAYPLYLAAFALVAGPMLVRDFPSPRAERLLGYLGVALLTAMAIFGLVRMAGGYPWPR